MLDTVIRRKHNLQSTIIYVVSAQYKLKNTIMDTNNKSNTTNEPNAQQRETNEETKTYVRNQNMFDVTNMTYEQYVETHYNILLEQWYLDNGFQPPYFPHQDLLKKGSR